MSKNAQRLSQVVSTFGPGAMVDLPTPSVVVGGLELWDMRGGAFTTIPEPRLTMRLEQLLKSQGRLADTKNLSLRTPPVTDGRPGQLPPGIAAPVFPAWFVCEQVVTATVAGKPARRRRLVRWQDLDPRGGRRRFVSDDGAKSEVTPIRFVCACENGHLQDIDWRWIVHEREPCEEAMWVEEKGTSADPADMTVACGCGKGLSLQELFQPGRLGSCRGERPWLLDRDPNGCGQMLKLLTRTATNTYFPQVYTVISLPVEEDELTRLVDSVSGELTNVQSVRDMAIAKINSKVAATLGAYSDDEVFARLQRLRQGALVDAGGSSKLSEFDVFASRRGEIGQNSPNAKRYAQTLPRSVWATSTAMIDLSPIKNVVAVHRLREVSCLYGFTRFEAAPTSADGDLEDIQLAVRGAPLAQDADWLPAIEQFGEGIFVHFDEDAFGEWLTQGATRHRHQELTRGYRHWCARFGDHAPHYPGTAYVLLHSLSHALMSEIALDCGYPASSLKERVYALSGPDGLPQRCGILIYTATAGAQGTLGGLVGTASRFAQILEAPLEQSRICSNDPICADHQPDNRSGDRATHGAACHGCLLIAETSCEMRNLFLDRNLLVPTMGMDAAPFFEVFARQ
jgi:hypothetical protein